MVDLKAINVKLTDRAERIITAVTGVSRDVAKKLLTAAYGNAKLPLLCRNSALIMRKLKRLDANGGFIRKVLLNPY